jgi:hypothetical protein
MGKSLDRGGRRQRSLADFIGRGRCGEKTHDPGFKAIDGVYQWREVTAALKFLYVTREKNGRGHAGFGRFLAGREVATLGRWRGSARSDKQGAWASGVGVGRLLVAARRSDRVARRRVCSAGSGGAARSLGRCACWEREERWGERSRGKRRWEEEAGAAAAGYRERGARGLLQGGGGLVKVLGP